MKLIRQRIYFGISLCITLIQFGELKGFFDGERQIRGELTNGYRYDRVDESYEVTDNALITPYSSSESMFKSLQSDEIGAKVFVEACNWVVKGNGNYGWILSGDYNRDHVLTGQVRGHTADWLIGLGYDLCFFNCLSVVPFGGYSYDSHDLKISHFKSSDPVNFPVFTSHAHKTIHWYGPWVGFDLIFDACGLRFDAGYEFHFGTARTRWHETDPGFGTFSTHTKLKQVYGHAFHFDTHFVFSDCWALGLDMEYTYWGNSHKARTSFGGSLLSGLTPTQTERVFDLSWHSFSVSLGLGAAF